MALIAEGSLPHRPGGLARVVIDEEQGTITFERCFSKRGLRLSNPDLVTMPLDDVLAVHDFVESDLFHDKGQRASMISTREGAAHIRESFANYKRIRSYLKKRCADLSETGPWIDNPNVTEPLTVAAIIGVVYVAILLFAATF